MTSQDRLGVILGHVQKTPKWTPTLQATSSYTTTLSPTSYQFTLDNPKLNNAQRAFYEENGFLVIPKLVSPDLIEEFRQRFVDIVNRKIEKPPRLTIMKDISLKNAKHLSPERSVYKIQEFVNDEIFSKHLQHSEILDYVECFTGPNIMAIHTMLINKPPDSGTKSSRHPMHQDLHYFPFRPANRIVCAWTAMEKVDVNNGCLFVVPGSHKESLKEHGYPQWEGGVNALYHGIHGFDHLPKALLEMEKGDTVFFHPLIFHGSGENNTQNFRKSISCHYASSDSQFIDIKGTSQEHVANEVERSLKKRGLEGVKYTDFFKYRSRCVRGDRINF